MRILIGVQGTGNGHLSRCHALAAALKNEPSIQADYLISGRAQDKLFDMEAFGDYQWRKGLSFQVRDGKVSIIDTISQNPWLQFWDDVRSLDLSQYDLVVTDFEPVTAWAARRQGVRCIGMGRQYAFFKDLQGVAINPLQRAMLKQFAPCDTTLGMHWEAGGEHVIPPLIHGGISGDMVDSNQILVYLPFEDLHEVHTLLKNFPEYEFHVFHPNAEIKSEGHIHFHPPSRSEFPKRFASSSGVLTNAGFETSSEALSQGKRLLVKPLHGQFEQLANANCLMDRNLATSMPELSVSAIEDWLEESQPIRIDWPDVAPAITQWLASGAQLPVTELSRQLWQQTQFVQAVA
ncbi:MULTISPECIES: glycosyltransferase family protein [Gammaproteobacteria]|uniref:glycosyltransferase family protein n=1 Tax=Gammaproteobacteria TaxID=1236 RepID=UPI000DD0BC5B|nr:MULTISPECIES: glycosyltransferase family protein [Gammaproteobacteria]RTE86751.1 glycosyltransferase [Aliidiomarina sp. B3213]TCZ90695.1 glycosyltransferase [Lysobacter sp. N42]